DVELPRREIGIRRPSVGHRADLQVLMKPLADKSGQEVTRESCPFLATCRAVVFLGSRSGAWPGPGAAPARRSAPDPHQGARRTGTACGPAPGTWTSKGPADS